MTGSFPASQSRENRRKTELLRENLSFRAVPSDETEPLSSQPRYDRFDTCPYMLSPNRGITNCLILSHGASPVMILLFRRDPGGKIVLAKADRLVYDKREETL